MPISTRGLGMATNATQQLAQLVASLGQQQAQGFRGIGDSLRGVQEDAARRKMQQAAHDQRQQQVDLQRQQFEQQNANRSTDLARQQEQQQALAQFVQGQMPMSPQQDATAAIPGLGPVASPQVPASMSQPALMAILRNIYNSAEAQAGRAFQGSENQLDRGHQSGMLDKRETGLNTRHGASIRSSHELQGKAHGHAEGMLGRRLSHTSQENDKNRTLTATEGNLDRGVRTSEGAANRASSEKIAAQRVQASGSGSASPDSSARAIAEARKAYNAISEKVAAPFKKQTREVPGDPKARAELIKIQKERAARLLGLLMDEAKSYIVRTPDGKVDREATLRAMPEALRREIEDLKRGTDE